MTRAQYQALVDRLTTSKDPKERALIKAITFAQSYGNIPFDNEKGLEEII